jgi:hypothetical protein
MEQPHESKLALVLGAKAGRWKEADQKEALARPPARLPLARAARAAEPSLAAIDSRRERGAGEHAFGVRPRGRRRE